VLAESADRIEIPGNLRPGPRACLSRQALAGGDRAAVRSCVHSWCREGALRESGY